MVGKSRLAQVVLGTVAAVFVSGGVAWAATNVASTPPGRGVKAADVTSTVPDSTSTSVGDTSTSIADTSTTVADTSTTVGDTTTTIADTTTTTVADTTTTTVAGNTTTTTVAPQCKPGWGYGDTNHCHSGPPGLNKHHGNSGHGHGKP